jgi:ABC-type uncharacterized transport system permease subunit
MLTYVAALLLDYMVRGPWRDPLSFGFPKSRDFAGAFDMPRCWRARGCMPGGGRGGRLRRRSGR